MFPCIKKYVVHSLNYGLSIMAYFLKAILIVIHLKLNKKCAGVSQEMKEHEELTRGHLRGPPSVQPPLLLTPPTVCLLSHLQGSLRNGL